MYVWCMSWTRKQKRLACLRAAWPWKVLGTLKPEPTVQIPHEEQSNWTSLWVAMKATAQDPRFPRCHQPSVDCGWTDLPGVHWTFYFLDSWHGLCDHANTYTYTYVHVHTQIQHNNYFFCVTTNERRTKKMVMVTASPATLLLVLLDCCNSPMCGTTAV